MNKQITNSYAQKKNNCFHNKRKTILKANTKTFTDASETIVRVITLSGVNTIGRNAYVVELNNRLILIDYGLGFPDNSAYNINGILPDMKWLIDNKKRLDAIIITHAHMDHVGGIAQIIDKLGYPPIYGSNFAMEFIKEKLKEFKKHKLIKLNKVISGDKIKVSKTFSVEFAHVTHSIPQAFAVAVNTPLGKVVYTGDFKFDPTPINDRASDIPILKKWAHQGILVALADSTNVYEQGHSKSETSIVKVLEDAIRKAEGRVIIGMFSSLVSRLVGILEVAKKLNKKVAFTGRSMETNVKIAVRIGYLVPQRDLIISVKDVAKYPDNQVIVISTGSQGEEMAGLTRMAKGTHQIVKLKRTDTIIMSSSVIPTNVVPVQNLMDQLARTGATVINSKLMDVHVSGHAYQEELKEMAQYLQAKYYIPVHGYTSFLFQHRLLLAEAGIATNRVIIPTEGSVTKFTTQGFQSEKKLKISPVYIVGKTLLDAKDTLIKDREQLASNGVVTICMDKNNINVYAKGVINNKQNDNFTSAIQSMVKEILHSTPPEKIKRVIYAKVGAFVRRKFNVMPVIVVLNS